MPWTLLEWWQYTIRNEDEEKTNSRWQETQTEEPGAWRPNKNWELKNHSTINNRHYIMCGQCLCRMMSGETEKKSWSSSSSAAHMCVNMIWNRGYQVSSLHTLGLWIHSNSCVNILSIFPSGYSVHDVLKLWSRNIKNSIGYFYFVIRFSLYFHSISLNRWCSMFNYWNTKNRNLIIICSRNEQWTANRKKYSRNKISEANFSEH